VVRHDQFLPEILKLTPKIPTARHRLRHKTVLLFKQLELKKRPRF